MKEINPKLYLPIKWAETEPDEITGNKIEELHGEDGTIGTTMLYNRLIHHLKGPPLTIHQTVVGENGLEVWRRLLNRFNPMTPMRGLQIMLKVMMPPKIGKQQDVHGMVNKWEGLVHVLERDYKENISDMMKIGILIHMMPEELQDSILQHADKIKEYKLVKEKAVNLVDARARLRDPDAMDVGYYGHYEEECDNDDPEEEVGAVTEDMRCYRCQGYGHRASDCATPAKGKGKNKGFKGDGKGKGLHGDHKGKGKGSKGDGKGRGQHLQCTHCGKRGHAPANCWTLHPDQMPWKKTSYIEEEDVAVGGIGFDVGFVDVATSPPGICKRESQVGSTWTVPLSNRFEVLSEDVEIGAVEVGMNLKEAGRGRITIDSRAAESVLPKNMLPNEPIVEGEAKRRGVKYVAANGGKMENIGEKKVKFKRAGSNAVNSITFQVTDVSKPLASVSRILDKGNAVIFSRRGSYILNEVSGEKIPIVEEKGTFGIDVEFLEPDFVRQG